jgi:hypothetical protein
MRLTIPRIKYSKGPNEKPNSLRGMSSGKKPKLMQGARPTRRAPLRAHALTPEPNALGFESLTCLNSGA